MNLKQVKELWNNQADDLNQWDSLSSDEMVEWALKSACAFHQTQKFVAYEKLSKKLLDVVADNMRPPGSPPKTLDGYGLKINKEFWDEQ